MRCTNTSSLMNFLTSACCDMQTFLKEVLFAFHLAKYITAPGGNLGTALPRPHSQKSSGKFTNSIPLAVIPLRRLHSPNSFKTKNRICHLPVFYRKSVTLLFA